MRPLLLGYWLKTPTTCLLNLEKGMKMANDVLTMADYYDANDGFGNMITWLVDVLDEKEFYALKVVTDLNGNTTNAVDDFLKCVFGYDFEQFYEEETR